MNGGQELEDFASLASMWKAIEAFEAGTWDDVRLELGGFRLRVSTTAPEEPLSAPSLMSGSIDSPSRPRISPPVGVPAPPQSPPRSAPLPEDLAGLVQVTAPSVGIFYAQPEPSAPPFVSVGDVVGADTTVCIVEVMKLMNHVKASISGTVSHILVENGTSVEKGQALFLVRTV